MDYKISTIIPIYNVEKYLEETIKSVIKQTIGFKNIQLILVNDGSPDNSDAICLKYAKKYPKNVVYIKQKNTGVSSARNNGMKYATGKYLNFLDADDKWDKNAYKIAYNFLEKNENINVAICRTKYFEASNCYSQLDYIYQNGNFICNKKVNPSIIKIEITSCFIKNQLVKQFKFSTKLKYAEDLLFLNKILLQNDEFGVLKDAVYNRRKRLDLSSAMNKFNISKEAYNDVLENSILKLIKYSIEKYKSIPKNTQYLIMYEIKNRLKNNEYIRQTLTNEELLRYKNNILKILKYIDDDVILNARHLISENKLYYLNIKNKDLKLKIDKNIFLYKNKQVYFLKDKKIGIKILDVKNDKLILEGKYIVTSFIEDKLRFEIRNLKTNQKFPLKAKKSKIFSEYTFDGELLSQGNVFKVEIPLNENVKQLGVYVKYKDNEFERCKIGFNEFAKINKISNSYYCNENSIIRYSKNKILIRKYTKKTNIKFELKYLRELKKREFNDVVKLRKKYYVSKIFKRKKLCLIINKGKLEEKIYKYIKEKSKYNVCLIDDVKDKKYKNKLLLADILITPNLSKEIINPYNSEKKYLNDLLKYDTFYIGENNLDDKQNRYNTNVKLFLTNSKTNKKLYHNVKIIKLTPRNIYKEIIDFIEKK